MKENRWLRLAILLVSLIAMSFGLACLLQNFLSPLQMTLDKFAKLVYLAVFATTLLANLTIIAPVPVATAIMVVAATRWDPILVSLFASIGGALGELSGYYIGYIGQTIVMAEDIPVYNRIVDWMTRYGLWAIFVLALQPILPFDIAGLVAGASKMPLRRFLPTLWVGRFLKYVALCYLGLALLHFVPS